MLVFHQINELHQFISKQASIGSSIGFVPTMGALHEGHLSLLTRSSKSGDCTICSVFVNPTQFNDKRDLARYPVQPKKDIEILEKSGVCDAVFLPEVAEIYPEGTEQKVHFDLGYLETILEGKFRPGHFQGVANVVNRLLRIVQPDHLYMGQKDYQQCMVIQRLLDVEQIKTQLIICPIKREPDGLAMSSRNTLLSAEQRKTALLLSKTLKRIAEGQQQHSFDDLKEVSLQEMKTAGIRPDYIALADGDTLALLPNFSKAHKMVVLIAAYVGEVRLIDNQIL